MASQWPSTLPQNALVRGYSEDFEENTLNSATDEGPGKKRPRFTDTGQGFKIAAVMTAAQKVTLDTFFAVTLQDGELPFTHVDPIARTSMDFEFQGPPIYASFGDEFTVTLNLIESI